MEVMVGFKHTELGVIPNEWGLIPLEKIADPSKKWSFTGGPFGSNLKSSDYTQDGVRVIQLQNIGDGVFHNESEVYTSPEKANELLSCNIYPNEIILSKMGDPVARASIIPNFHDRYLMCSDGIRLSVNPKEHNNYFIFLSLNFNYFRKQAESASTGSTRKRIGLSELRQLNVICPKVDEQNEIAKALSDADALIESLEKLIEKKRQIKQGVLQELLTGKKRLPGFSGEWSVKRLADSCQLITKGTTPTSLGQGFTESGINFIKVESLNKIGEIIEDMVGYIDEETHELLKRSQLKENDLLVSIAGALGRAGIVNEKILPANTNQALAIVRFKDKPELFNHYVYYFIGFDLISKHIAGISAQGAQANLSLEQVGDFPIYAPDIDEQKAIVKILKDIDSEIAELDLKLTKACQIKQGMMQELLTGRIRLV